jgi:hypothetical protein
METKDIIGQEFEFFHYDDVQHLKWDPYYAKYIGSKCIAVREHVRHSHATLAEVFPTIGKKFTKNFPTEQIKEQIEKNKRENMSIDDILSEVKQLTSQI